MLEISGRKPSLVLLPIYLTFYVLITMVRKISYLSLGKKR